jgi:hypothetical protein
MPLLKIEADFSLLKKELKVLNGLTGTYSKPPD